MQIYDGRPSFYQWDLNQKITSDDFAVGDKIHFSSMRFPLALVVKAYELDGKVVADVPNILLQTTNPIRAYRYITDPTSAQTIEEETFLVNQKAQPPDYFYTETELYTLRSDVENAAEEAREATSQLQVGLEAANTALATAEEAIVVAQNAERISTENESGRVEAETQRLTAENERVLAEAVRVENENQRIENENARLENESTRQTAELNRRDAESEREMAEQARDDSERDRMTNERDRVVVESERVSAENMRSTAEENRHTAELARKTAETNRQTAEQERLTAETQRLEAEVLRAEAEEQRVEAEAVRQEYFESYHGEFANAITATASGEVIRVDDVSPVEHTAKIKISGKNLCPSTFLFGNFQTVDGTLGNDELYRSILVTLSKGVYTLSCDTEIMLIRKKVNEKVTALTEFIGTKSYTFEIAEDSEVGLSFRTEPKGGDIDNIKLQIELGDTATEYEPYVDPTTVTLTVQDGEGETVATYTPEADGTVNGITSVSPTMTLLTDTAGVTIEAEYNQDTNVAIGNVTADIEELDRVTAEIATELDNRVPVINEIHVAKDGSGDFTDLPTAIESINDSGARNIYNVYIHEGTYNTTNANNIDGSGLVIPNYVNLIGIGNRDNIILQTGMTSSNLTDSRVSNVSVLNVNRNHRLENLYILAQNCRYGVHSESGNTRQDNERTVVNCRVYHKGNDSKWSWQTLVGWGEGCSSGDVATYEGCVFEGKGGGYLMHNNTNFTKRSVHTFKDCSFRNTSAGSGFVCDCITISSKGSGQQDLLNFHGCTFSGQGVRITDTYGDYTVAGAGNGDARFEGTNTFTFADKGDILYNWQGSTVAAWTPVKSCWGQCFQKLTNSDTDLFLGVTLTEAANYSRAKVMYHGIIPSSKLGVSATAGKRYKIANGTLTETTAGDHVFVCRINGYLEF